MKKKKDDGLAKYYDYECESDEKETKNDSKSSLLSWLPFCLLCFIAVFVAKAETDIKHEAESMYWYDYEYAGTEHEQTFDADAVFASFFEMFSSCPEPVDAKTEDYYFVLFEADNGTILKCQCTYSQFVEFNKSYKTNYEHIGHGTYVMLQYNPYKKVVHTQKGQELTVVNSNYKKRT
jgi:hypothetical protein